LEDVCYNISSKIISRSTIQYILKEGVEIGFFEKITNEKDKREKYYKITQVGKKSLEDWAFSQKKVFSNLNTLNSK
jgi:DNA-binding MarR family transcriptional regulator